MSLIVNKQHFFCKLNILWIETYLKYLQTVYFISSDLSKFKKNHKTKQKTKAHMGEK